MFIRTASGIETWQVHPKVFVNYIHPKLVIPQLSDLEEQTIIIIEDRAFIFKGDKREELLATEGDLRKILQWYQQNVWSDKNCRSAGWANAYVSLFHHKIRRYLSKKKK